MKKLILIVLLLAVVGGSYYFYLQKDSLSTNKAHGMVDIRQASLSFELSGRITNLNFDEGDMVKSGDVLAKLDTQALNHQIAMKEAECMASKAQLSKLKNGYEFQDIEMAKAQVDNLKNAYQIAKLTSERFNSLYNSKSISAQEKDKAFYAMEEARAQLKNAQENLKKLEGGFRPEEIASQEAALNGCMANLDYLNYQKNTQAVLLAPFDGQIRSRLQEVGDMASPSSTIYELSMINDKRVRVYALKNQLDLIKVGDSAKVFIDDKNYLIGKIAKISNTAMFTPKTVQTEDLRADLVYEVRIDVKDSEGKLRLGEPVTVELNNHESSN